ncbi:hypothetical protein BGZ65_003377 [Modicella reniformis]|uniref:Acidic fibroblast growth factor intracellular-binding protein n=1 Tax=Modicella reniformis TaxID=1440133 RepID=A0A9P6MIM0_9FUNG|nr:hypothetical protein BGZ65_003377 [Modicella reniformis]
MSEWMVTASSAIVLDESILQLWLLGHNADQATLLRMPTVQPPVPSRVLKSYIVSQYRTYEMMQHFLHNPRYFAGQFMFPLSHSARQHLIENFDEDVIREILGKRLNSRARKDLDEFDNLKRVMKRVEDAEGRKLIHDIEHQFLLPRHLASQYAHILFIADNKLDTFRKRLSCYQFSDFEYCASVLMQNWTSTTTDTLPEFDPQLAQDSRDLKSQILNDRVVLDEFKNRVSNSLSQSSQPPATERIQNNFKVMLRNMLSIGCMVNQQKEVRNIFVEITDKLVDAFMQVGWSTTDMELFYDCMIKEFLNLTTLTSHYRERYRTSWTRVVTGIKLTSIRLFKQPTSQSILQRSFTR